MPSIDLFDKVVFAVGCVVYRSVIRLFSLFFLLFFFFFPCILVTDVWPGCEEFECVIENSLLNLRRSRTVGRT